MARTNIPVDEALDAGTGLPAASGVNSLTLNGTFYIAVSLAGALKANNAKILLSAFKASVGTPPPRAGVRRISGRRAAQLLRHLGIRITD